MSIQELYNIYKSCTGVTTDSRTLRGGELFFALKGENFDGHEFDCLDTGFGKNEPVDVVIRPEDVDVEAPEKGMLRGVATSVTFKGVHWEIIVDINNFKWMIQTTDYVAPGAEIGLHIEPDAIHIMKKSEFSGMYGDYSSFSDELEELSDPDISQEEDATDEQS